MGVNVMTEESLKIATQRKLAMAIENTQKMIEICLDDPDLRLNDKAFTRVRSLGAKNILHILLHRIYHSLQLCLDKYFGEIHSINSTNLIPISKQAFSQSRKHLNPEYVREFVDMTSELAAQDNTMPSYNGMRLIAIDGSDVALENTPELKEAFGCSGPKNDAATALCSIAYGPLDHVIYDCRLDRYNADERDLAKAHVKRLSELGLSGSLLLFDRGYPSAEFVGFLYESNFQFVMRIRSKFNVDADNIKTQDWINLNHNGKEYPVRILKVTLNNGETETLLTSLNQKQLPIRKAGSLYFERWKVEIAYDLIKSKLELENFSGKSKVSVYQDFYATMYLANIAAFAAEEADEEIANKDNGKPLKYPRKANRTRIIAKFREIFLRIITEQDKEKRNAMLDTLISDISRYPIQVVPNRSPKRKLPRKKRFFIGRRSIV
jgi:hypothetical protein